jgi:hypothetical protein
MKRLAAIAAASVARTISNAMFLSGLDISHLQKFFLKPVIIDRTY